jgi:prophage DNA circulation protein
MSDIRPSEQESAEELLRKLETILAELRAAATAPPDPPESWTKRRFHPSPASPRQGKFNLTLIEALTATIEAMRASVAEQDTRLARLASELEETRARSETLDSFRERSDRLEAEMRSAAANVRGLQERAAALEGELAQVREQSATELAQVREQLTGEQNALASEMRERIQHLLDEQRVCIRQLSLQASEQTVLADRARRATELKLEELARHVGLPPG